jgi:hypothetical protein
LRCRFERGLPHNFLLRWNLPRCIGGTGLEAVLTGLYCRESRPGRRQVHHPCVKDHDDDFFIEGHPAENPMFYEIYNTKAQIVARTHPGLVNTQRALLSFWHASDPNSEISLVQPISYFDRFRIREPGPAGWSLGPHIDGGGVERWEDPGLRSCYARVFEGGDSWKQLDSYDVTPRLIANQDLYDSP